MNSERCQTCTVMISQRVFIIQKMSCSNKEDTSTISQNLSGSLSKPRNFIGDGSICEDSTWQQSPYHLKNLPLHYEVKSWYHAKFQLFDLFYIKKKLTTKKSIFSCFHTIILHIALPIFLHKASTCGEDGKRDFCTIICVLQNLNYLH